MSGTPEPSLDDQSTLISLEAQGKSGVQSSNESTETTEVVRVRTAQACSSCQKKKAKCDGQRPQCQTCRRLNRHCAYTGSKRDKRQQQLQSLQRKAQIYQALLGEILSQTTVHENVSIGNIVKKHFQQSPDVFGDLILSESMHEQHLPIPSSRISLGHMFFDSTSKDAKLVRPVLKEPPVQVNSIERWTTLMANDTASHLLSFYFTWENPRWNLIDQDMFLQDLENHGETYCSRLLVHVLLFFGISFSYRLNHITDRREEKVLGQKLYDHIQPLWEKEKTKQDLPTIQSGILLGLLSCTFGVDRLGTQFIMNGARSYSQQALHIPTNDKDEGQRILSATELSQEMVSWAIFDVQALASQVYRKVSPWPTPPPLRCSPEQAARLDENSNWSPYPFENPTSRPNYYTTLQFRSALAAIVNEIASFSLKLEGENMSSHDQSYCHRIYQRLVTWKASLPRSILPESNTTPHILCLHFYYQATLISLSTLMTTKTVPPLELDDPTIESSDFETVKDQAMETIGSLILLFKHRHGWKSIPIVMLHYFCLGGVHATSRLDAHDPKWTLVLESCVVGLWHMSLGWGRLCKAFLRTIELVLKSNDPDPTLIPIKVVAIFQHLNSDLWSATDVASLSADYVVQRVTKKASPFNSGQTLEDLIRAMENL